MTLKHTNVYLLLGGNIGERISYINKAIEKLGSRFEILNQSSVYETAAWGDTNQMPYLNVALKVKVNCSAEEVHKITRNIEYSLGRREKGNYQPRTIDIDILFYGDKIIETKKLVIPHERLHLRNFVLVPLNEIEPSLMHPKLKKTVHQLFLDCEDKFEVELLKKRVN